MEDCKQTRLDDGRTTVYARGGKVVTVRFKHSDAEIWYNRDGEKHRVDGPAEIWYINGQIVHECWYRNDIVHRDDGPAIVNYVDDKIVGEYWYCNGVSHRDDGPATVHYRGDITKKFWQRNGKWHRVDGPAVVVCICAQIVEENWYRDDERHRDDGPAMILYKKGQKIEERWYRHGIQHRDGQPAIITYKNGKITGECWYRNGDSHRDGSPAEIRYNKDGQIIEEHWCRDDVLSGNVLAYIWLANINDYSRICIEDCETLDDFRDAVKGPLALELMRPLPTPIRDAIYEHYCLQ
jgi:antitoxin component YwqK of YwqJK toxin-antitoxin module